MARSVGNIEVQVDAVTKRLKAQLIKDGTEAGVAAKEAIEEQLDDLNVKLTELDDSAVMAKVDLLRTEIVATLEGIAVSPEFDMREAREELIRFREIEEAEELRLRVALGEADLEKVAARLRLFTDEQRRIFFDVELDSAELEAAILAEEEKQHEIRLKAALDDFVAKAELEELIAKEYELQIQAEFDRLNAEAEIEAMVAREHTIQLLAELDDKEFRLKMERLGRERRNLQFHAELDLRQAELDIAKLEAVARRTELAMPILADTKRFDASILALRSEMAGKTTDLTVLADVKDVVAEMEALQVLFENNELHLKTEADTAQARATLEAFRAVESLDGIDIPVHIDTKPLDAALTTAEQKFAIAGQKSGEKFNLGLESRMAKIGALLTAFLEPIAVALQGLLASATSVLSSAIQALGGAAGAAAPLIAAFGAAIATVVIGAKGFTDGLKAVNSEFAKTSQTIEGSTAVWGAVDKKALSLNESIQGLAPSATAAALAFADVRGDLADFQTIIQQDLFTGMSDEIHDLAETALPSLQEGMRVTAQSVNDFGRAMSDIVQDIDFEGLLKDLDPALDDSLDGIKALAGTFEPFLRAAAPAAERLAEMFERTAEAFRDWVLVNPDKLAGFLDDGLTSLREWGILLGSTADLLGTIFDAGAESGDNFVVSLNNIIERWDSFLESAAGQDSLKNFFDSGHDALKAFQPALDGLKEAFSQLTAGDAMENFGRLAQAIGDVLPVLAQFSQLTSDLQITTAIATLAQAFGQLIEIIRMIPGPMLEIAGALIVANKAASLLSPAIMAGKAAISIFATAINTMTLASEAGFTAVESLRLAIMGLSTGTGVMLALTAAITVAIVAWKLFFSASDDSKKKTEEFTKSLENNLDAVVANGDAADRLSVGMKSLNEAMLEVSGDKLEDAFIAVNDAAGRTVITVDDTVSTLASVKDGTEDSAAALAELAVKMGLPADAAKELGRIVNETDDNLDAAKSGYSDVGSALVDLAEKTGIPKDRLIELFGILEEIQDKGEDMDLSMITDEFDKINLSGTDAERSMLAVATSTAAAAGHAGDAVEIWKLYSTAVFDAANVSDDASSVNEGLASSYILVNDAIQAALAAHEKEAIALAESRAKAFDAWQEQLTLAKETENAASEILASGQKTERMGKLVGNAADDIIDFGNSMRDAADQASALEDSLDFLLNPFLDLQEAEAAVQQNTDDLTEALMGGADVMKLRTEAFEAGAKGDADAGAAANAAAVDMMAFNKTLDLGTQAGRDNAEQLRTSITGITDFAAAQLTAGVANTEVATTAQASRDALIAQAAGFFTASESAGTAEEQAANYINTLGLTPELIDTVFTQPGLIDALLNAQDLTLLYDAAGNPVLTEFEALGIEITEDQARGLKTFIESMDDVTGNPKITPTNITPTKEVISGLQGDIGVLGETHVAPTVELPDAEDTQATIDTMQEGLDALTETTAHPKVKFEATAVQQSVDALQTDFDTLGVTVATPEVTTASIQRAIDKAKELRNELNILPTNKTITVTTVQRTVGPFMTGGIVTGPATVNVGERGLSEAIVPLQLPLNRVDPSVRQFAEILRGGSSTGQVHQGTGKVVNNYMTITPVSADPGAVATQVINRSASMANR